MYVCMHVCMYVYMHKCMYVCMYVCVHTFFFTENVKYTVMDPHVTYLTVCSKEWVSSQLRGGNRCLIVVLILSIIS